MILVLHGPNLNLLGEREPAIYGNMTLKAINEGLIELGEQAGFKVECYQSNHEGQLIDWIHEHRNMAKGMIINPGGLTHTSVALADALAAYQNPIVEVHLSNIASREDFRRVSYVSPMATGVISGLGANGYNMALQHLITLLSK
jgi:3-dehydroquinate dehydratase-2